MSTVAHSLFAALKDRGARAVFGIPGDFALPYFKVLEDSALLPLFTLSHEPAVGFAADAAGRFAGGLGVAAVTYGAGALNMVNAISQAFAEKSPLVVISGAPGAVESQRGLLLHHQVKTVDSQFRIMREITCDQAVLDDPVQAPERIRQVLASCLEHSQPVYIEIPRDMALAPCEPVPPFSPSPVEDKAVAACARAVLRRIEKAGNPVLMAGVEVRRFGLEDKLLLLARSLDLPVVTSFMGRGLLAGSPLLRGTYLGAAGDESVTSLVESSDLLLLAGVIISDTNFGVSARHIDMRRTVRMLDRKVAMGYHVYHEIPLDRLVDALLEEVGTEADPAPQTDRSPTYMTGLVADNEQIAPDDIARGVNDLFDSQGPMPVAADMGDCLFTSMAMRPTPLVAPGYYASMGFGVPAGLGIQAATGQRPLILVGDGAFQMTGFELGHCHRLGLDPIVLVFNNASWEMLRTFQPGAAYHDLGEWRFAELAEALGGTGRRVQTRAELAQALAAAHASRGVFQLVEIMLPRGALSGTLSRFVASVKRLSGPS